VVNTRTKTQQAIAARLILISWFPDFEVAGESVVFAQNERRRLASARFPQSTRRIKNPKLADSGVGSRRATGNELVTTFPAKFGNYGAQLRLGSKLMLRIRLLAQLRQPPDKLADKRCIYVDKLLQVIFYRNYRALSIDLCTHQGQVI